MRIPLTVTTVAEGLKPFAYVIIRASRYRIRRPIRMFVDTGSPWTTIAERDATLMGVPFRTLREGRQLHIAGISVFGHLLRNVEIGFKDENNNIVPIKFSNVYALKSINRNKKAVRISKTIPNILGVDFLLENKLALYFDPSNKISYLEKVEVQT